MTLWLVALVNIPPLCHSALWFVLGPSLFASKHKKPRAEAPVASSHPRPYRFRSLARNSAMSEYVATSTFLKLTLARMRLTAAPSAKQTPHEKGRPLGRPFPSTLKPPRRPVQSATTPAPPRARWRHRDRRRSRRSGRVPRTTLPPCRR